MCNCKKCFNLICSTSIEVIPGQQVIITIPAKTLNNGQTICLVLAQNFAATEEPVFIINGDSKMPLLGYDGNFIRGEQLLKRCKYRLQVATTPELFIVRSNNLCPTSFVQPQITNTSKRDTVKTLATKGTK